MTLAVINIFSFMFLWYFVVETNGNTNIKNMALILRKTTREINALMRHHKSTQPINQS
jgi:hypothetical protein